jgi:hypothetical protein
MVGGGGAYLMLPEGPHILPGAAKPCLDLVCYDEPAVCPDKPAQHMLPLGGLLDRSTAWYFYKDSKTSLHKPTANSGKNIFFITNVYINMYIFYW